MPVFSKSSKPMWSTLSFLPCSGYALLLEARRARHAHEVVGEDEALAEASTFHAQISLEPGQVRRHPPVEVRQMPALCLSPSDLGGREEPRKELGLSQHRSISGFGPQVRLYAEDVSLGLCFQAEASEPLYRLVV
eukprot:CAMPEP_0194777288 /NCGR_PEP_ID=MMETSP0323_2-20130528/65299_1 /TAXON_ID=2866 ORGANISM="Crypthecodinium cohnii, Strain Seligo" /NCGR_SAMPLE_ID=MMETSP0323_2 /ASSEMBLY_ACC=CAM_ASM_000346 /LENGTH=134 /DNA_ID=CAMNT_0039714035 /DNA_START=192 /DNA_END=592 /DNA_ORIENTATION=-